MPQGKRKRMTLVILVLAVLSPLLLMAFYVEDWSRDLSTNVAWTDPGNDDPTLRPIEFTGSWSALQEIVSGFAESRPNWSEPQPPSLLDEASPVHDISSSPEGEIQFHLVRTTGLIRYKDDVWVVAEPIASDPNDEIRWRLHVHSQSRVGKGDLGQNPRNIRELLTAIRG